MVERLLKWLDSSEAASLDNLLAGARQGGVQGPGAASSAQGSKETEATAELDSRGLLQLQQQTMVQQDEVLGQMEKTVRNTKHIALAIGEEVDLQTRLLDELDEETDVKQLMKQTAHWRGGLCIFLLIVTLVFLMVLFLKISHLFT
ncbi:syntaxin-52, partial [Haematococcus lacustris]